jgi:hypothetical protein
MLVGRNTGAEQSWWVIGARATDECPGFATRREDLTEKPGRARAGAMKMNQVRCGRCGAGAFHDKIGRGREQARASQEY